MFGKIDLIPNSQISRQSSAAQHRLQYMKIVSNKYKTVNPVNKVIKKKIKPNQ